MEQQLRDFFRDCDEGLRMNEMAESSDSAAGRSGVPIKVPTADRCFFQGDAALEIFMRAHLKIWARFDPHYFSSIPYRLEEDMRQGDALLRYAVANDGSPIRFYNLGAAESTLARTLAELGEAFRCLAVSAYE
ncbi:hypothetical protein [Ensifer aridi]|uniref:hypothetical protein n=1 Tax=Ensifer aridi TaxID=1708715 RepID=UPI001125195F|nr:hypothetical protein [Ensifer aridi]